MTQPPHQPGYYEEVTEYLDVFADQDLVVCNYSQHAGGFLTGKYERADSDVPESVKAPRGVRGSFDEYFGDWYASE